MEDYGHDKNIDTIFIKENAPNVCFGVEKIKTFIADLNS